MNMASTPTGGGIKWRIEACKTIQLRELCQYDSRNLHHQMQHALPVLPFSYQNLGFAIVLVVQLVSRHSCVAEQTAGGGSIPR